MKSEILITGATGTTGGYVIQNLKNKDIRIRAMVRVIDERSKKLEEMGVSVVKGDFLDLRSLRSAMTGIKRAYFCYPFKDGLPKAAGYVAKAAKENGVELMVFISQMNVHDATPSPATQNHLIAEDILDWAGIGAVHIRPGLFAWNYLNMAGITVKAEGKFYFPNPEARYTIIHPGDIGDVAAEILTSKNIKEYIGKKYILTGPRVYTGNAVAEEIGGVLSKQIQYLPISVEKWIEFIKSDPYVNDFLATHLLEFSKDIADGRFNKITDTVVKITGQNPRSFKEYIQEHIEAFT